MSVKIVDPRTGTRVTLIISKPDRELRAKAWVLRELDRLANGSQPGPARSR
jgi:hypothetical protein